MIGTPRDDSLGPIYGSNYVDLFSKTRIGIRYESEPKKITYYTNHCSFKKATMKPFKKELVKNPQYRIFVLIDNELEEFNKLKTSILENRFVYSPYLGHAYCPAVISEPDMLPIEVANREYEQQTTCVILDESNGYKKEFELELEKLTPESTMIIERHLHHNILQRRVLKYWIPVNFSKYRIQEDNERDLSKFYRIDDKEVVCMF